MSGVLSVPKIDYVRVGTDPTDSSRKMAIFSTSEVVVKLEDLEKDENLPLYDDEYIDDNSTDLISAIKTQSKIINHQANTNSKLATITLKGLNGGGASQAGKSAQFNQSSTSSTSSKKASSITTDNSTTPNTNNSNSSDSSVLKPDLKAIIDAINSGGIANALKELSKNLKDSNSTSALNGVLSDINSSLNQNIAELVKIGAELGKLTKFQENYLKNQGEFLKIEQDRHKFETTKQIIRDLDGQEVANMSPRDIEISKNASQARIATDTNNFELDSTDIDDLFGDLPDISELFDIPYSSEILKDYLSK